MKFHFQVIDANREELNPVISGDNGYEALHTLIEVCRNNNVIPERITLVDTAYDDGEIHFYSDEEDIPCIF